MLDILKNINTDIQVYSVNSEKFRLFGRIIKTLDADEIIARAKEIDNPPEGSSYIANIEDFHSLKVAAEIQNQCFGTLPAQIGYCWGHNSAMNAMEWHTSSEINIAVTPLVLILGHIWDIVDGIVDSSTFKAFYLPEGTMVEVYATSLHFCPCQVNEDGFGCVVALPAGTNTELTEKTADQLLYRRNKWIIAHNDNQTLINKGVQPGISGKNFVIKY